LLTLNIQQIKVQEVKISRFSLNFTTCSEVFSGGSSVSMQLIYVILLLLPRLPFSSKLMFHVLS